MFRKKFIALVLFFVPMLIHLEARQSFGEFLTAVNDTYAGGDQKLSIQTVRFSLDCNVQCTKTEYCNAVNFGNNTCELLRLSDDYEDRLQLKPGWTFSYRNNTCLSIPCENEGSCNGQIGGYTCICPAGYEGVRCQDETDECLSSPCENGSSCEDFLAGYNCICADGYEGVHCQNETDECLSSPCENGGSCEDFLSGYNCTCPDGYKGVHCQWLGCPVGLGGDNCQYSLSCDSSGSSGYLYVESQLTWHDALSSCAEMGGRLAEIYDSVTNECLKALVNGNFTWIAGSDEAIEGDWRWATSNFNLTLFSDWYPGYPNNIDGNQHCLELVLQGGLWNDYDCYAERVYICEFLY